MTIRATATTTIPKIASTRAAKTLKQFAPSPHYLVAVVKKDTYKDALEQLCTRRNYAAHDSEPSKRAARAATGQKNLGSAGSRKTKGSKSTRLASLVTALKSLASDIENGLHSE